MKIELFASVLQEARKLTGQSQRELAQAAGTSQSVVGRIEAGLVSPTAKTLHQLVHAAGFELQAQLIPRPAKDKVVELYKRDVDRTLLRENLRRSVEERWRMHAGLHEQGKVLRKGMLSAKARSRA